MTGEISARDRAALEEQVEELERNPFFRDRWAETNRRTLLEAAMGLPLTNAVVLGLPPPSLRTYIRLLRSSQSFACDVLSSDALRREHDENIFALMRAHLIERSAAGYVIHRFDGEHPSAADLRNEVE